MLCIAVGLSQGPAPKSLSEFESARRCTGRQAIVQALQSCTGCFLASQIERHCLSSNF